jgi:hypothetical protein
MLAIPAADRRPDRSIRVADRVARLDQCTVERHVLTECVRPRRGRLDQVVRH